MRKQLHSEPYTLFLGLLRETRERRKISQSRLAERLRVHQSFVSKCETGARRLDAVELLQWLRALRAHPEVFIRELDERMDSHRITQRFLSASPDVEPQRKPGKSDKP